MVAGAQLRKRGIDRIRMIDHAGGIGGTWYWNRYPGVMCDVESYCYMPMLEEMGYIPKKRYAFGEEIREHLEAIAERFDLVDSALFHTGVQHSEWDDEPLALGDPHRSRRRDPRPVPGHGGRDPQPHEDAGDPGDGDVRGRRVPHRAVGLRSTPAGRRTTAHDRARPTRSSAIIGTGASAIQAIPPLAESSKQLYVFQRTPAAVGVRGDRPTDDDVRDEAGAGLAPASATRTSRR